MTVDGARLPGTVDIRAATVDDAPEISALITGVAHYFTLHPRGEGAEKFLESIQPPAIEELIEAENHLYAVALVGDELAGVVSIRDNSHLLHLFVAPKFQRRGIARRLWEFARDSAIRAGNTEGFTVFSTPYAVPVYERFGFEATGPRVEKHGIAFVPMKWEG